MAATRDELNSRSSFSVPARPKALPASRVGRELADRLREPVDVVRLDEVAAHAVVDLLGDAADAGRDHGQPAGHGFEDRHGQIVAACGQDEDVQPVEPRAEVGHEAVEARVDAEPRRLGLELRARGALTVDLQCDGRIHPRRGGEQDLDPLVVLEVRGGADDDRVAHRAGE